MPLGRRQEGFVLLAALMLASAGVALAATVDDKPASPAAARVTPRRTTTTATTLPATTTTTAPPRIWPDVADCPTSEPDRPAILSYAINTTQGPPVPYAQALRMAKVAGISTDNLVRQGEAMWWGYAEASGTVGTLLGPARKLVAARSDAILTNAQLYCAGHHHNTDLIWVLLREGTEPGTVIARAGLNDVVAQVTDRSGGRITAYVRTFAALAVEHAIAYLAADGVLAVLPSSDCVVGAAAGALTVPKNLLPTSTSSTASTSSTTSTSIYVQYDYSYPTTHCGTEVTAA